MACLLANVSDRFHDVKLLAAMNGCHQQISTHYKSKATEGCASSFIFLKSA